MSNLVAVVVPLSGREELIEAERISLNHMDCFLSRYPRFFVAPGNNRFTHPGFERVVFHPRYFGSREAHNKLLLSEHFYRAFGAFDYVLIHHLDSLVFADSLEEWCGRGFDLIAPPWVPGPDLPWCTTCAIGNGGLSLRRVAAFRNVLRSRERWRNAGVWKNRGDTTRRTVPERMRALVDWRYRFRFANGIREEIEAHLRSGRNEDLFWWKYGKKYFPDLKIATIDAALSFGFEANPRLCYKMNGWKLPFGCHAWERYDREFWEPFLLTDHSRCVPHAKGQK